MAFEKIAKGTGRPTQQHPEEIRMGYRAADDEGVSHRVVRIQTLYLSIANAVIERVGWKTGPSEVIREVATEHPRIICRIAINEGTDSDAGFLLLAEDPKGYSIGTNKRSEHNAYSLAGNIPLQRFKYYDVDSSEDKSAETVEFTVDEQDHTILVQCPSWLTYKTKAVEAPPPPPPEPNPRWVDPFPTKREVAVQEIAQPFREGKKGTTTKTRKGEVEIIFEDSAGQLNRSQRRLVASKIASTLR